MKAISIRQPWAWLIVNGHKDIENRSWPTARRGTVLVHASKGMTRDEYDDVEEMLRFTDGLKHITLPRFEAIERGGIVGMMTITGCVTASESPWFFGPQGFKLAEAEPLPFTPFKGALGFFNVPDDVLSASKASTV